MKPIRYSQKQTGFTVIELLVCIAIIMVLAGIVFAALAPVREKGRQAVCTSNLKQIGQAIAIYRADWGGKDPDDGISRYWELGLPLSPKAPYLDKQGRIRTVWLLGTPEIWRCPNFLPFSPKVSAYAGYGYAVWDERLLPHLPSFSRLVAERGEDYPLVFDQNHNSHDASSPRLVIVLRLGGHVQARRLNWNVPSSAY